MLIDSHAHVHDPAFDADRDEVFARAREAGVSRIVCVGATDTMDGARAAVRLAAQRPEVAATVGVHPHDVAGMKDGDWDELRGLCADPRVVAVGETGLDYYYDHSPRDVQVACFRRFVRLAREVDLPLVVHVRDAHEEALEILASEGLGDRGAQIHCFTGTAVQARRYLDLGAHLSFTGIVTFRKADELREAARVVPLGRLLVETDCPYLAPVPRRGKRNEPAYVRYTAEFLAELLGVSFEELATATSANARRFFALGEA